MADQEKRMELLWAPWRLPYVKAASGIKPADDDPCFICRGLTEENDRDNILAWRREHSVVYLNRFPYNNGHLLIAPRAHKGRLDQLNAAETLESMDTMQRLLAILDELMHPDGYNIGINLGRVAGAGLPGHLHWHIVPRWNGDTNFMPIFADVKVIVQSLEALYDLLVERLR